MIARRVAGTPVAAARLLLAAALALALAACRAPGPGVIRYDTDACDHCRMTIADASFAAQLVTTTGKVYRFDDPGCLASFVAGARVAPAEVHAAWVNDHERPDTPVRVEDAVFVISDRIRTPMNSGVAAFGTRASAAALQARTGGQLLPWADVVKRSGS